MRAHAAFRRRRYRGSLSAGHSRISPKLLPPPHISGSEFSTAWSLDERSVDVASLRSGPCYVRDTGIMRTVRAFT